MSSGFVSGGTTDNPIARDEEWLKAQQEVEANRLRKEEEGRQEGGKSLYEVLQNNKAAKQEAFEQSIRLKNQFRTLDEDEVEFLDSVLESTRAKEAAVKKETTEQLDQFRRQQELADKAFLEETEEVGEQSGQTHQVENHSSGTSQWAINARKRKRVKEKEPLPGVKLRKSSTNNIEPSEVSPSKSLSIPGDGSLLASKKPPTNQASAAVAESPPADQIRLDFAACSPNEAKPINKGLGLAVYSSDEE
ncbi:MAG: hypothetical protein Q9214_005642 [Letrouitia sp. 1 TL-2023]